VTRILPATVGAVGFGILTPITYLLVAESAPPGGLTGIVVLAALGAAVGGFLGWRFPGAFYFLVDMFS
jgi:hypothetical protein